jgi:hypothetical protein
METAEMFPNSITGCRIANQKRNDNRVEVGITDLNIYVIKNKNCSKKLLKIESKPLCNNCIFTKYKLVFRTCLES